MGKKKRRNYDSPMRVKNRSAKKLQFSNRSQGKKSQERNCDSPIRVKKKCEENFRCSNPYRARNSSNKDDASQTKSGMRETQRERQTRREKQSKRESESQVKRGRPNTPLLPFPVSRSPKKKKKSQFVGRNLCGTSSGRSVCE
jgi:hypothetical protein